MTLRDQLSPLKKQIEREKTVSLELPNRFAFKEHDIVDFNHVLSFFDWGLEDVPVRIDLRKCLAANYQAVSLIVLYAWKLKAQGCKVTFIESDEDNGASALWRMMGARGTFPVLLSEKQQFKGNSLKPLLAVRNNDDFKSVIETADTYTDGFNVEYSSTLRYVLSELLYNALEHGRNYGGEKIRNRQIPAISQFTWYKKNNEIHFIIADTGVGIKEHIEQAYPGQDSDVEAIKLSLKAQRSGTFGVNNPYTDKNNAGMGLYISSNIVRRLNADMYVVSGEGVVHVSPRDVTGKILDNRWPGTFVLVTLKLEANTTFVLYKMMQEFREEAEREQKKASQMEVDERYYVSISNYFGSFAENKEEAINFRDRRLFPALKKGQSILLDFDNVTSSPHSFLSALLASPIKSLGMSSYKKIKVVNASPEIRETIDFILDDNTG
ncbi:STAS-like domain-containing protein [Halomonas sp. BC04]|uniref:STAS-like domain-containing protein n=1 Tax=Halomonas sp. BC04 TaxID=1403540 RepID=UPI0004B32483|nr:DUF4325 domain-containing protein [Halomonas sp. BC04]